MWWCTKIDKYEVCPTGQDYASVLGQKILAKKCLKLGQELPERTCTWPNFSQSVRNSLAFFPQRETGCGKFPRVAVPGLGNGKRSISCWFWFRGRANLADLGVDFCGNTLNCDIS